jgi:hypothetical protein
LDLLPKLRLHLRADLFRVYKQHRVVCGDYRVGKEDGIELDVGAAQVEQPRDLVEHRHHQRTRLLLFELLAYARELCRVVCAGIFDVEGEDRFLRARRSRGAPDQIDEVLTVCDVDSDECLGFGYNKCRLELD